MCSVCVSNTCGGQKRVSDHLELELWVVVSCHEYAGDRTRVCWESSQHPEPLSISPATIPKFLFKDELLWKLSGHVTVQLEM